MNLFSFKPESAEVRAMFRAYVGALLWTMPGPDGDENPGDRFTVNRLTREARIVCLSDCLEFLNAVRRAGLVTFLYGTAEFSARFMNDHPFGTYDPEQLGHDLALSRNGHGAGFFDREALRIDARHFRFSGAEITGRTLGDELQDIARTMGERDVYTARGWVYVS